MSDKPKSIQEALVEVQKNLIEAEKAKTNWADPSSYTSAETATEPSAKTAPKPTPKPVKPNIAGKPGILSQIGKTIARNPKTAIAGAALAAGTAALGSEGISKVKQFGKDVFNQAMTGQGPTPIKDMVTGKQPEKTTTPVSSGGTGAAKPGPTTSTSTGVEPTPKPEAPKPAAADKPVTYDKNKYAIYNKDSSSAKSFRDTFAAQKAAGASEFKWKGGDNVERSYSTKSAPETKSADVPLPPSRPTDLNKPESESGGKKKKMSEETNPLIAAFLKLQESKAANMFEAAKKAKKDYDEDGEVESPKDEVWGSRFKAAKAAGKMEEGSMMDPNDPSVQGGSDVTSTPAKKAPASRMSMPTAPKTDSSVQGSGDVTKGGKPASIREAQIDEIKVSTAYSYAGKKMEKERKGLLPGEGEPTSKTELKNMKNAAERTDKDYYKKRGFKKVTATEEVEFSQAEIDHLNSFFEAVAPSRAEPTKGVNPSVNNISLTDDTLAEGRPKKNPTPETSERDARQHIQVIAGRAAAGNTLDFPHNDGSKSKITPAMGRKIVSHLQGLKPAERQAAVNKMHASAEGLKI